MSWFRWVLPGFLVGNGRRFCGWVRIQARDRFLWWRRIPWRDCPKPSCKSPWVCHSFSSWFGCSKLFDLLWRQQGTRPFCRSCLKRWPNRQGYNRWSAYQNRLHKVVLKANFWYGKNAYCACEGTENLSTGSWLGHGIRQSMAGLDYGCSETHFFPWMLTLRGILSMPMLWTGCTRTQYIQDFVSLIPDIWLLKKIMHSMCCWKVATRDYLLDPSVRNARSDFCFYQHFVP